ncbi:MAG: DNA topoisomerase III, partial [Bacteroidaceae bacterium]|nr:DNA topoisomerase III [Bacteroidaceae bacterium]
MKVCIAEKPSVAREIARVLGATRQCDGFLEGNGYRVTWTVGHLCELKYPEDYTPLWRAWSLAQLPMVPQRFGIRLKDDKGIIKQFHVIERLFANAEEIINLWHTETAPIPVCTETTMGTKKHMIETKILPYFKDLPISKIDSLKVREWQTTLINDPNHYEQTYLKVIHNQMSAIMNYAVEYYNLPKNPAK